MYVDDQEGTPCPVLSCLNVDKIALYQDEDLDDSSYVL